MFLKLRKLIDNFYMLHHRYPTYICLGKLEVEELRQSVEDSYFMLQPYVYKKVINTIDIKFGSFYGVKILPVDFDTFCEVV